MGTQENVEAMKTGYAAFARGDVETMRGLMDDGVEWLVRGSSSLSGIKRGKDETLDYFAKLGEKGLSASPQRFIGDGNTVVVLADLEVQGEQESTVNLGEYNDQGKLVRFEAFGAEELMKRVFG